MKLNITFSMFDAIRTKMNAPLSGYFFTLRERLEEMCVDFDPKLVRKDTSGIFFYRNEPVVLYIGENDLGTPQNWSFKYHLFECHTIDFMEKRGRRTRYKVSARTDGQFFINSKNHTNALAKLTLCANCFQKLSYPMKKITGESVGRFSLQKYFQYLRHKQFAY